jgi:pyruvate/oxaloacetate carboxyltransferase
MRTEDILAAVKKAGGDAGIDESKLGKVLAMTNEIRSKYAHAPIAS